jgi:pseudouridine-5'-phosphate glycosidase
VNARPIVFSPDVEAARREGRAIVALESSVFAQGLPRPRNAEAARRMLAAVRESGATPGVTAVIEGAPRLGLEDHELSLLLEGPPVGKASSRDLPLAVAARRHAATTVAASLAICRAAGVSVFATGGIGGVHREPPFDESADLVELARSPVLVVCAGAKSVLDLAATLERLETLAVSVVGYRTAEFPGFFFGSTGLSVGHTADRTAELVRIWEAHRRLELPGALLVVQPPPPDAALRRDEIEAATALALDEARREGIRGSAVTPFLLGALERVTAGRTLTANLALLEENARLAGVIARALVERGS